MGVVYSLHLSYTQFVSSLLIDLSIVALWMNERARKFICQLGFPQYTIRVYESIRVYKYLYAYRMHASLYTYVCLLNTVCVSGPTVQF